MFYRKIFHFDSLTISHVTSRQIGEKTFSVAYPYSPCWPNVVVCRFC